MNLLAILISGLSGKINQLSSTELAIFQILLDKGLLALLLLIAGGIGTLLLERYKALLQRRDARNTIYFPLVLALMEDSESLLNLGHSIIDDLTAKWASLERWALKLVSAGRHNLDYRTQRCDMPQHTITTSTRC